MEEKKAIAVLSISNTSGIEILEIEYGTNDVVVWRITHMEFKGPEQRSGIFYEVDEEGDSKPMAFINGSDHFIDEFIRTDIGRS